MEEVKAKRRRLNNDYSVEETDRNSADRKTPDDFTQSYLSTAMRVNGEVFAGFHMDISSREHFQRIKTMPMREDDVIIVSFPNSGARWIWEMTQMLMTGHAEHDSRTKEHLTLELNPTANMASLTSPRVLCSHLVPGQLSNEIVTRRSRVIHVMRNPKDLVVSYYFRSKQLKQFEDKGLQEFVWDFLNCSGCEGTHLDYFSYLREILTWQDNHPEIPTTRIFYEDVVKNPVQSLQRLAQFLGLSRHMTDALCAEVADQCSFHRHRDAHDEDLKAQDHPTRILYRDYRPRFFRKGEVGDWKNHFTMALSEHFDTVLADRLRDLPDIPFQYAID